MIDHCLAQSAAVDTAPSKAQMQAEDAYEADQLELWESIASALYHHSSTGFAGRPASRFQNRGISFAGCMA